jgi:WD40 repeat protein
LVAFTGEGKYLATTTTDSKKVALYRVPGGQHFKTFTAGVPDRLWLSNLDASADGRRILSWWGSDASTGTVVWDVQTGEEILRGKWWAYFSLDGKQLLSYAPFAPESHLMDSETGERVRRLPTCGLSDRTPTVMPGGRTLLRCNATTWQVEQWDGFTGKKTGGFDLGATWLNDWYIRSAFSPDGKRLLTAHDDGFVRLWDVASATEVQRFPVRYVVRGLTFSADGRYAAGGTHNGWFYLWRLPGVDAPPLKPAAPFVTHQCGTREHVWNNWIYHAAFSSDGQHYLVTGSSWHNQVRVWDTATGKLVRALPGWQWAEFTPDGKQILACGADNALRLWDLATGREVRRFSGHTSAATRFDVSADGQRFLSSAPDGTVRLWDLKTGKELGRLEGQSEKCFAVLSPDGCQALSSGADRIIRLWDLDHFREVRSWKMPGGEQPHALRFLPDGRRFVAVSVTAVRWFDTSSAREVKSRALDFAGADGLWWNLSRDAAFLMLMPKSDRTLRVQELSTDREVARFQAPEAEFGTQPFSPFGVPALSPDRRRLVVAVRHDSDQVGRVYLYPMPGKKPAP